MTKAYLVLDDGRIFEGRSWGATGRTFGEAVFQTGMTGYQETLTDPSYHKQVVVMTAPHIGNTGMNKEDNESSKIWVAGYVVRNPSTLTSNFSKYCWYPRCRYARNHSTSARSRLDARWNLLQFRTNTRRDGR
jgi:carbamoylphosphate synthase small subunit